MSLRMNWLGLVLAGGALISGPAATRVRAPQSMASAVLAEINFARTHPAAYARTLRSGSARSDQYRHDEWSGDDRGYGGAAREEAIDFLVRQRPVRPLTDSRGLSGAAAGLAAEQSRSGRVGHSSALRGRAESHGVWSGMVAEAISYGMTTPASVVQQLIIDEGVPGRGHREVLFDQTLSVAGVGCGPHRTYGYMCVIDFAGAVVRR